MNHELVNSIPLFAGVGRRERKAVAALVDEVVLAPGTTVVRKGSYARDLYVVVDGTADVVTDGATVTTLGPGDVFGERTVLGDPSRTATVVAGTPLRVLVSSGRDAVSLVGLFPTIGERVRAAAASRTQDGAS